MGKELYTILDSEEFHLFEKLEPPKKEPLIDHTFEHAPHEEEELDFE